MTPAPSKKQFRRNVEKTQVASRIEESKCETRPKMRKNASIEAPQAKVEIQEAKIRAALDAYRSGRVSSIKQAARNFDVQYSTLQG
jgi:hypothetical protein